MSFDWWRTGSIYHVYPRSFMDANGDGVGDLEGIRGRLDHLADLGVDALWLSPVYPSPMADFGYDVADYTGIDPLFGTLEDFDRLLQDAHARGLRVILDLVANHTSDRHPWFEASRRARGDDKRAWYIWRDPAPGGGPPNNWLSEFGGPAWTLDARTGQYYLHSYLREQPDLNWRHPAVEEAVFGAVRFWLDRGVDGFRLDAISHLFKDDQFRDNPPNPSWRPEQGPYKRLIPLHVADLPETHAALARLRALVDGYPGRVLIGELYLPFERLVTYYGRHAAPEIHLPTNFVLLRIAWTAEEIARAIGEYEAALPQAGWPNWVLGNHDKSRVATRLGPAQARVAALLLLTLRGTPTIYYGDEIGMEDVPVAPEDVRDPWERNVPGLGLGRDPERSPMRWDAGPNAGFTTGTPWLPVGGDVERVNVAAQRADPGSPLALHRRLLALRRAEPALGAGSLLLLPRQGDVVAYERRHAGRALLVVANVAPEARRFDPGPRRGPVLLSTHAGGPEAIPGPFLLRPDEALVVLLSQAG